MHIYHCSVATFLQERKSYQEQKKYLTFPVRSTWSCTSLGVDMWKIFTYALWTEINESWREQSPNPAVWNMQNCWSSFLMNMTLFNCHVYQLLTPKKPQPFITNPVLLIFAVVGVVHFRDNGNGFSLKKSMPRGWMKAKQSCTENLPWFQMFWQVLHW